MTPDDIEELSRQLERAGIAARHEMIGVWRAQGWEPEEIEDGVAQLEKALAGDERGGNRAPGAKKGDDPLMTKVITARRSPRRPRSRLLSRRCCRHGRARKRATSAKCSIAGRRFACCSRPRSEWTAEGFKGRCRTCARQDGLLSRAPLALGGSLRWHLVAGRQHVGGPPPGKSGCSIPP